MHIKTMNPATGVILHEYPLLNQAQVDAIITLGADCFQIWRHTTFAERASKLLNLASILRQRKLEYATLMAKEMGKPIALGCLEIEKSAFVCEHYATKAQNYLLPREITLEKDLAWVCYEPLGVVFAIMPWNFPFWQVFRFAAPNIMAGNVGLLKHAAISTGTGHVIAELFLEAGFPHGVFQQLVITPSMVEAVIASPHVVGVTLTGSESAGRSVAAQAGSYLKKSVLELGGADAYVVFADADLDHAAKIIVASRLSNTGQVCIAAKRVIVVETVFISLLAKIKQELKNYVMGDPLLMTTTFGPMARADLRQTLHDQVQKCVKMGAKLHVGGCIPDGPGFYYPATLLTDVAPGMPAFDEELFGPVVAMILAKDETTALNLANQSRFGLGAAIFTQDVVRGQEIATHILEAGSCFVNAMVSSDPRLPFGGIKQSGFGRELSAEGIHAFMNVKTVLVHNE